MEQIIMTLHIACILIIINNGSILTVIKYYTKNANIFSHKRKSFILICK